jgi:hypothetical protein
MLTNIKYLPLANEKFQRNKEGFKYNIAHLFDSCGTFFPKLRAILSNMLAMLLGISVGLIYGAQAFKAFLWANIAFSIIFKHCQFFKLCGTALQWSY